MRCTLLVGAVALALTFWTYGCAPKIPDREIPDTLPLRLTNPEFWHMVTEFSEESGSFRSDNFVSNESEYQRVIPSLVQTVKPGGIYIGVGPEQNFTYITALQPTLAFIIDIRRQNMLEHLFYKALMETSVDRADFLSRLFGRSRIDSDVKTSEELFRAYRLKRPIPQLFETNLGRVLNYLKSEKGFNLSREDEAGVRHIAQAFFKFGPDLRYTSTVDNFRSAVNYSDLMTQDDGLSRNWSFLATEDRFRAIQSMQQRNLIVPLVGDFAGPLAILSVGKYAQDHGTTVHAFYTSNVEEYLFADGRRWNEFYRNVVALPVDSNSTFIRYVPNGLAYKQHRTMMTSKMASTMGAYRSGLQSYYALVSTSQ
jgi:hypothetical protein